MFLENLIRLKNVTKEYRMGKEIIVALDNITLDFERGKIYCLLGVSGSGKSTLLNIMAGLEPPTKGQVIFGKQHMEKLSEGKLAIFRRKHIGFIFQSYNLLPTLTALENVTLPLMFNRTPRKIRKKKAMTILKSVGLSNRVKHKPSEMSGGQQQRVSIARALVNNPEVVFADEPTGNLDTNTTIEMMDLICGIVRENGQTLILVTHNPELTKYCDKVIHIRDGHVEKIDEITHEENLVMTENTLPEGEMYAEANSF